ncbi:MAG: NTP transferase domain-containing protein [Planctomycetaceae bacterium]|nr:NTP transferase domain-containing protein [Planctomycetaceae bacterium]
MADKRTISRNSMVIILAAGKGTRMGRTDLAKVCFEIDSQPAINRTINTFQKLGFEKFLLVVGSRAEDVMAAAAKETPAIYIYQQPQLGTGHAAKLAAEALENTNYTGNILVTMGDKYIESDAIELLVDGFVRQQADLALLSIPIGKSDDSSGRIFCDKSGQVVDIIEKPDIACQAIGDDLRDKIKRSAKIPSVQVRQIINKYMPSEKKQTLAVGELLNLINAGKTIESSRIEKILEAKKFNIEIAGEKYTAAQIQQKCKVGNPSLYMFKPNAFYKGTAMIDNNNAQGEYYLTDIVKHLSRSKKEDEPQFRVRAIHAQNANWIQGFNSPNELLSISDYIRRANIKKHPHRIEISPPKLKKTQYCTVTEWLQKIEIKKHPIKKWLNTIYGSHEDLHKEKISDIKDVLKCYGKNFGWDERVCIVRAPGRVNLMGRHVDHRGGFVNFLAIDKETIAVAGLRQDNNVVAYNVEPKKFEPVKFNISELIGRFAWSDWINFVNSDWVKQMLYSSAGNWGNYIKAALLRLQHQFTDVKVSGLNMAFCGNVPIAAGLSSSSTIVVASLQAAIALNNFDLTSRQFIDLCGEGEWFVGSRGGAGDHAAIHYGQRGKIAHVSNLPMSVDKIIDAPADYQLLIANSHIKAAKSEGAKHIFNAKVASYNLGLALLKQRFPEIADRAEFLRDLNPENLGCATSDIYKYLLKIPQKLTRNDLKKLLGAKNSQMIEANFASHKDPGDYNIRGVLLFGIAEMARSKTCIDLLEQGKIDAFGELMKISHNGDRVCAAGADGKYYRLKNICTDDYLNKQIANLASEDPEKVLNAQLYRQCGEYGCSTEEIDRMVDIACGVEGVAGAQIAGAGLGGCIMILVQKDCIERVKKTLIEKYYRPAGYKPAILSCITTEGACLADF